MTNSKQLSGKRVARIREQGYFAYSDQQIRDLAYGNRFVPRLCLAFLIPGVIFANISFDVATVKNFPGKGYDLVTFFDCLHDMGDPVGACAHVIDALDKDGKCMIVEPFKLAP